MQAFKKKVFFAFQTFKLKQTSHLNTDVSLIDFGKTKNIRWRNTWVFFTAIEF